VHLLVKRRNLHVITTHGTTIKIIDVLGKKNPFFFQNTSSSQSGARVRPTDHSSKWRR